jgi:hypothetical protein
MIMKRILSQISSLRLHDSDNSKLASKFRRKKTDRGIRAGLKAAKMMTLTL